MSPSPCCFEVRVPVLVSFSFLTEESVGIYSVKNFLGRSSNRTNLCRGLPSSPAAPQSSAPPQETPEEDPTGRPAFQAGWLNDLVTKVSVGFFCEFKVA